MWFIIFSYTNGTTFDNLGRACKRFYAIQCSPKLLHLKSIPYLSTLLLSMNEEVESRFLQSDKPQIIKRLKSFKKRLPYNYLADHTRETPIRNWKIVFNAFTMAVRLGDKEAQTQLEKEKNYIERCVQLFRCEARPDKVSEKVAFKREYVPFAQLYYFSTEDSEELAKKYLIQESVLKTVLHKHPSKAHMNAS